MRNAVVTVATLVLLAGCGSATTVSTATTRDPVAVGGPDDPTPYDGPMKAPQSFADRASALERSGAAGLALECDAKPYAGGGGSYEDGLESVQSNPSQALQNWLEKEGWGQLPTDGYQVERDDGDRVLLSYDANAQTKIAFIAADGIRDYDDDEGWGIESWAQCDPSELPARVSEDLGYQVWEDESGARVPLTRIQSYQGPEHCDWQDITFLLLGADNYQLDEDEVSTYLRDPDGELADLTRTTFEAHVSLPDDARDTGLHRDGRELWLVPSQQAAYLVSIADPDHVERWPAANQGIACA